MSAHNINLPQIKAINSKDEFHIEEIEKIARLIWTEHYSPIIGLDQVNYMLEKYQSKEAMIVQIQEGYQYYSVYLKNILVGYFSVQPRDKVLFLSKAYLLREYRGQGIFSVIMSYIEVIGKELGLNQIELTVNKHNSDSHKVYESIGFIRSAEAVFNIGNGYVMDDYIYQKQI